LSIKSKFKLLVLIAWKKVSLPISFARLVFIEYRAVIVKFLESNDLIDSSRAGRKVFNIDLHIAVIEDFSKELNLNGVKLTRFSISNHNHIANLPLPSADPVSVVNQKTWKKIDREMAQRFQHRYRKFLSTFDGFIVTHSPAFVALFSATNKPILVVASTRYEFPYTGDNDKWKELNSTLIRKTSEGEVTLIANNTGDADYLNYFTGIDVKVLPSYCGGKTPWTGALKNRVTLTRDNKLKMAIVEKTNGLFQPIETLGIPYKWSDLMKCLEVFVIPQNISTMTLFELATAGVPVVVPGRNLFRQFRNEYEGVLDELTFAEIYGLDMDSIPGNPANWKSDNYLDWWLDRADFYNHELMPNIRVADTFEELTLSDESVLQLRMSSESEIKNRNIKILKDRQEFMTEWTTRL
jgi:hypothetical protein